MNLSVVMQLGCFVGFCQENVQGREVVRVVCVHRCQGPGAVWAGCRGRGAAGEGEPQEML